MTVNIIEYITQNTKYRQKDLSDICGVSRAQVSKWKSGEYLPHERAEQLLKLVGLFGYDLEWALLTKTEKNAKNWKKYFVYLDKHYSEFSSRTISDETEFYVPLIINSLVDAGIKLPDSAPSILKIENDKNYEFTTFDLLIIDFLDNYGSLINWLDKHILNKDYDILDIFDTEMELQHHAIYLAITYLRKENIRKLGINMNTYEAYCKYQKQDVKDSIINYCKLLNEAKIPFEIDYFNYLNKSPNWLEDEDIINEPGDIDSIVDLLPCGERLILESNKETQTLITELHKKIDIILENKTPKNENL